MAQQPILASLRKPSIYTKRRLHTAQQPNKPVLPRLFLHNYFLSNNAIDRGWIKNGAFAAVQSMLNLPSADHQPVKSPHLSSEAEREEKHGQQQILDVGPASPESIPEVNDGTVQTAARVVVEDLDTIEDELPHRRRKRLKDLTMASEKAIPLDASAQLAKAAENMPASASFRRTIATYLSLSKPRLSFLIVLTSTAAYSLYPIPEMLSSTTTFLSDASLSTSTLTLAYLTTGTFLSSASANTLNMLSEPKYDALMSRTRNRPLVRNLVTPTAASLFALTTGTTGLTLLALGTNPTVAILAALNIFLYAGVYTPMKRFSVLNTWVGALVGGIPPLMGWAAAAGQSAQLSISEPSVLGWQDLLLTPEAMGGWLLAALLFAWQFPHFNALAHPIRDEYRRAGFRMLAWTNPARNGRVALRYSLAMFPICLGLYGVGVVNEGFLVLSSVCNLWMTRQSWVFWTKGGAGGSARGLFWASIWSLPLLMVGALVCKTGVWDGVFDRAEADMDEEDGKGPQETRHAILGVWDEPSRKSGRAISS